ncbi:hypothetical protein ACLB2K_038365 [Fragaria x ananassa]
MSNSQAESYNNMIKDERCMPLPQLLEGVRVHMMNLFTRRLDSSNWGSVLCPKMEKKLLKRLQTGRSWTSQDVFEVFTETCNVMVNLAVCECSCRHWEFRCFPCAHVVQVMNKANLLAYDCIEDYWKTTFYMKTYELPIFPVPDLDRPNILSFGDSTLQPPKTRRSPGRPKSRRIRSFALPQTPPSLLTRPGTAFSLPLLLQPRRAPLILISLQLVRPRIHQPSPRLNVTTYTAVIESFAKQEDKACEEECKELVEVMISNEFVPNAKAMTEVLKGRTKSLIRGIMNIVISKLRS